MLRALAACVLLVLAPCARALDSVPGDAAKPAPQHASKRGNPSWAQLSAEEREALAPLAADWDKYDPPRKKKWLEIAARYKNLSPEGKQTLHERMPDLAKLTPEQRLTARENFKRAYALPPEKRRALTQQFQELPEEKKRELAEQAKKKPATERRRPAPAQGLAKRDAPSAPTPSSIADPRPVAAGEAETHPAAGAIR